MSIPSSFSVKDNGISDFIGSVLTVVMYTFASGDVELLNVGKDLVILAPIKLYIYFKKNKYIIINSNYIMATCLIIYDWIHNNILRFNIFIKDKITEIDNLFTENEVIENEMEENVVIENEVIENEVIENEMEENVVIENEVIENEMEDNSNTDNIKIKIEDYDEKRAINNEWDII